MRDEREKRDGQEIRRTPPAHLAHRANPATLAFLASPASRACRAPCGRSSALSLTDPHRTDHTQFQSRAEAPRLIQAGRVSVPFLVGLPTAPIALHRQRHARNQ